MTLTISQAFELPQPADIRAMRFVVKLLDFPPDSPDARRLVDDYVVTPAVRAELPRIFKDIRQVIDRGEDYGRFVHGSFGSGKSHFLALLSLLLENVPYAWEKDDPAIAEIGGFRPWVLEKNLLVVRLHMLSARGRETGLDRAVYEGFNTALKRHGKAPFEFLNVEGVIEEARHESETYGDAFWVRLANADILGSREDFEALADGHPDDREEFARQFLRFKGRDATSAGIDPRWSDGLRRLAEHARDQGFQGVVLLVDEFLLWLAEKGGREFVHEINDLNLIVDHTTGQRAVPICVFVAIQRNIKEFFPDLVGEDQIHEHLEHHLERFDKTRLQDVELRHIVKGRVLRPRDPAAVAAAVGSLAQTHARLLPALVGDADVGYLEDVYPFHPALIETLIDVSSLMQRERSALRLLYELLVFHAADLPLPEFIPVGSAFAAIFPVAGVEASQKGELLQEIHREYYQRLDRAIDEVAEEARTRGEVFDAARRRGLDQVVKTVLLGEVSRRLRGSGLTIERLVQLNSVDVEGESYRGRINNAELDLRALSRKVPELQVAGKGKTALVRYVLGQVSLSAILARILPKVRNNATRLRTTYGVLRTLLGVAGSKGFRPEDGNDGDYPVTWRGTTRRGSLKFDNVRELPYADFEAPGDSFRILVDYPWDEPGHSVDEDRLKAQNVRKMRGNQYTTCWLPRHFSPHELEIVDELSAVRLLLTKEGQQEFLTSMSPADRQKLVPQAETREASLEQDLRELLCLVYRDHGELVALQSDIDGSRPFPDLAENLKAAAKRLLDRRYPAHPDFPGEPKKADIELLLAWMKDAAESGVSVHYDEATGKALRTVGQPLELVDLGSARASLRLDSRFVKDVLQRTDQDSFPWEPVAEHLAETYGFQAPVVDLFLCFVCARGFRALRAGSGEVVEPRVGMPASLPLRLERAKLLDPPEWSRLRALGPQILGGTALGSHRSLPAQDAYAAVLRKAGQDRRTVIQGLHQRLVGLGVESGDRLLQLKQASARLAPLAETTTDSFATLTRLLAQWPAEEDGALREVVARAPAMRDALGKLKTEARRNLLKGQENPTLGPEIASHLALLEFLLAAADGQQPLTEAAIEEWNAHAETLVRRLIEATVVVPPPVVTPPVVTPPVVEPPEVVTPPVPGRAVIEGRALDLGDPDEVGVFVGEVRSALAKRGQGRVRVTVTVHGGDGGAAGGGGRA